MNKKVNNQTLNTVKKGISLIDLVRDIIIIKYQKHEKK